MNKPQPPKGRPVIRHVANNGDVFEIYQDTGGMGFVGYHNGERSVAATRADLAMRGLAQKHLPVVAPAEKIVDFAAEVKRRFGITIH